MGGEREDDHFDLDQFFVIPTHILREQIKAHRRTSLDNPRRDGNPRRDLGHWTLRLNQRRDGGERPNYGFAQKWETYRDAWKLLDG
jgi:hypothetical protein